MRSSCFRITLIATILSFIFVTGVHAISSVNPTPGQSDWTVTSNIGVVLDEVTPYQPTAISDDSSGGSSVDITSPGIYRLSAPMTKPITITANNVELDLNEYGISLGGSGIAIAISEVNNVVVRNGYLIGSGGTGIFVDGATGATSEIVIKNIKISGFGIGINLNGSTSLELCKVISCTANGNSTTGFNMVSCDSTVFFNCIALNNPTGFNISGTGNIFNNCTATSSNTAGFSLAAGTNNSLLTSCVATSNTTGFSISNGTDNMIQSCLASGNTTGYSALGSNFAYQNRDITGSVFAWVNNVAASP